MTARASAFRNALLTVSLSIGLVACGGGGGGESASDSWVEAVPPAAKPEDLINARISAALSTGSAASLTQQDQAALLKWALSTAEQQRYWQKNLLGALYSNAAGEMLQPSLQAPPRASLNLYPADLSTGMPFAMADGACGSPLGLQAGKGCGLGVAAKIGKGRALAYG